jgi:hypothetical protein
MSRGRLEVSALHPEFNDSDRIVMIEIQILLTYEKQFRNLQLQESRLARRRERETAELRLLQQEPKANEAAALESATQTHLRTLPCHQSLGPTELGFEFSKPQFDSRPASLTPALKEKLSSLRHAG